MSRSATPATRNKATPHVKPAKATPFAKLTIGTAIPGSRGRLRTVASGCRRLGNVERTHPQPPDPQSETGTLATHSGKNNLLFQLLCRATSTSMSQGQVGSWEALICFQSVTIGHRVLDCFVAIKSHQQSYYPKTLLNSNRHFKRRSLNSSAGTLGVMGQFRWIRLT